MKSCNLAPNCSILLPLEADPDVAGIGVTAAFLVSAYVSVLLVLMAYFIPSVFPREDLNTLDDLLTESITNAFKADRLPERVIEAAKKTILMISDQQLITGTSIFIVGFAQHCTITQYHFYVVYLLAFMSFTVHQSTIVVLREELRKNTFLHLFRTVVMVVQFIMLLTSQLLVYSTEYLNGDGSYAMPFQCIWGRLSYGSAAIVMLVFNIILTSWGALDSIIALYPELRASAWVRKTPPFIMFLLAGPSKLHRRVFGRYQQARTEGPALKKVVVQVGWLIVMTLTFFLFLICFTLCEVLTSQALSIWRIYTGLIWASIELLRTRKYAAEWIEESENGWGFGQLLPLLLLILPILSAIEIYSDARPRHDSQGEKLTPSSPPTPLNSEPDATRDSNSPCLDTLPGIETRFTCGVQGLRIRRLSRVDTEQRVGSLDNVASSDNNTGDFEAAEEQSTYDFSLEDSMYESRFFRCWLRVVILGILAATIYGAAMGYAI